MNQLQNLVNDCLLHTKHVENAAIVVAKSGGVMARTPRFQVLSQEAQMFTGAFKHLATTREQGLYYEDQVFSCVRADRSSIYCKCGGRGLILIKTALFVIAATYNEDMLPSVCVEAVEKLAEYLREKGK